MITELFLTSLTWESHGERNCFERLKLETVLLQYKQQLDQGQQKTHFTGSISINVKEAED